jgi:hypothetical protein
VHVPMVQVISSYFWTFSLPRPLVPYISTEPVVNNPAELLKVRTFPSSVFTTIPHHSLNPICEVLSAPYLLMYPVAAKFLIIYKNNVSKIVVSVKTSAERTVRLTLCIRAHDLFSELALSTQMR